MAQWIVWLLWNEGPSLITKIECYLMVLVTCGVYEQDWLRPHLRANTVWLGFGWNFKIEFPDNGKTIKSNETTNILKLFHQLKYLFQK
jgi:hypothetical protein